MRMIVHSLVGLALMGLPASYAAAQPAHSDKTIFTFDGPVEVPGATLPAGRYQFRLMDSPASRQIVQIWNEDRTKLFATTMTVATRRLDPKGDIVVKFASTEPGMPPAVKAWFYPGDVTGHQFVYPEEQASRIAKTTKTLVLSSDADPEKPETVAAAIVREVDERGGSREYGPQSEGYVTHQAPKVEAAPDDRAEGSGKVSVHGLEGEDLAEHNLKSIIDMTKSMLGAQGTADRGQLERIRDLAEEAFAALNGETS